MLRAVLIDVDDTLLDFDACARQTIEAVRQARGIAPIDYDTFRRMNLSMWKQLERGELTREQLYAMRWNRIFAALGIEADGVAFEAAFRRELAHAAVPVPGARETLAWLAGKYTVCAASNAPHAQQLQRLGRAGLLEHLQAVFTSESVGAAKPAPAFFDACLAALAPLRREEVILIGDSLTADVAGGAAYGLQTCWFDRSGTGSAPEATYTIRALEQLRTIL